MKIGLINLYSTRNAGDAAIHGALESILNEHEVLTLAAPERMAHLPGIGVAPLGSQCDAYVSVGGDIFNNARPWLVTRTFMENLAQLARQSQRTILFGQSIPASCKGLAFRLLCQVLKALPSVTVRDRESWSRLRREGVDAHLSYDLAFVHRPSLGALSEAAAVFASLGLAPERVALLSLRGFDRMYPHDEKRFIENMALLCRQLRIAGMQPVLLLQSEAEGDDLAMAGGIVESMPARIPIIDALAHPKHLAAYDFLQGLLALAGVAVGVRFHTSVLALAAGRLPFNLYYSNKGRDLSERLNIPGCDLASFDPSQGIEPLLRTANQSFDYHQTGTQVRANLLYALESLPQSDLCLVRP